MRNILWSLSLTFKNTYRNEIVLICIDFGFHDQNCSMLCFSWKKGADALLIPLELMAHAQDAHFSSRLPSCLTFFETTGVEIMLPYGLS